MGHDFLNFKFLNLGGIYLSVLELEYFHEVLKMDGLPSSLFQVGLL
jgi:hypothetical protein